MALTLKTFKKVIPGNILARGRDYYTADRIVDLSLDGDDEWTAEVQGTDRYEVRILQEPGGALTCECTCPYDMGEYCKHVAAVLYAIEETFPEYVSDKPVKPRKKRATKLDKLKAALEKESADDLRALLLALAAADRELLNQLLVRLDAVGDRPADIRQLVKAALRAPRGSYGYLDYWESDHAARRVAEFLGRAQVARAGGRPEQAVVIYQVVFEETARAVGQADDSNGMLAGIVEQALNELAECAGLLRPQEQEMLFRYYIDQALGGEWRDWDWGTNFLEMAADLTHSDHRRAQLDEALAALDAGANGERSPSEDYDATTRAEIRLSVIRRMDGEEAALDFIRAKSYLPNFRALLIDHHLEQGELDMARALAAEGIAIYEAPDKHLYGLATRFRERLVDIAVLQGDKPTVAKEARQLWQQGREPKRYFQMRDATPPEDWPVVRRVLLKSERTPLELAAWAYAQEELWDEFRQVCLSRRDLLETHRAEMERRFPQDTAEAYSRIVTHLLDPVSNRTTYQQAAHYLVRMKNMGRATEAAALARGYIERYPQRRAMVEELKKAL